MPETAYPQYFDVDHVPARIASANSVPEIYSGKGQWKPYSDRFDLMTNGKIIDAAGLQQLISDYDAA